MSIKLLATGAFLAHGSDPHAVEYSYDEIVAAVEEARHKGLKVAAHAHSTEGIKNAVRAGVASIEHGTYVDDEGLRLMKERGTYLVADIYDAEYIRQGKAAGIPQDFADKQPEGDEIQRQNFRKAVQMGVKIAYGTDASVYPHGFNARQFAWQVRYGQTPMEAIRSATVYAADLIGRDNLAGSLEPGKWADLIAVAGDPLAGRDRPREGRLRDEGREGHPGRAVGLDRSRRSILPPAPFPFNGGGGGAARLERFWACVHALGREGGHGRGLPRARLATRTQVAIKVLPASTSGPLRLATVCSARRGRRPLSTTPTS